MRFPGRTAGVCDSIAGMATLQICLGALLILLGLAMLVWPTAFAGRRSDRRTPPVAGIGLIVVGIATLLGLAQNQMLLVVLSVLLAVLGLVLVILGLVRMLRVRS